MTGSLRTSRTGIDLIKSFEGFRPASSRLADGRWTIGYGHVRSAREGVTINEQDAEDLLRFDLRGVEETVNDLAFAPLNQNQFDALVSLAFNISPGQFRDSAILRNLNAGDYMAAAQGFEAWRKARINGQLIVVDALVRRRAVEKALFLDPPAGRSAAPTPVLTPVEDADVAINDEADEIEAPAIAVQPVAARVTPPPANGAKGPSPEDIQAAIEKLASTVQVAAQPRAPKIVAPQPQPTKPVEPPPPPEFTARKEATTDIVGDAARLASQRIANILARPAQPQPQPQVKPVRVEPPPPTDDLSRDRKLIDDTETYDPGCEPDKLFAESEARVINGAAARTIVPVDLTERVKGAGVWIALAILSLIGLSVGLVETNRPTGDAFPGAVTVAAVFGLLAAMSGYYISTRLLGRK